MANCLIAGCGDIGTQLAYQLLAKGHSVTGLKRHPPTNSTKGLSYVAADLTNAASLQALPIDFDQVYFILAPDHRDATSYQAVYDKGLNNLLAHFSNAGVAPPWIMVSSTSVYAQDQGEWVDETSAAEPVTLTSIAIRQAEQRLLALSQQHCIVRFSGIYGPGRDYLIRQAQRQSAVQQEPPYYTNRIHALDCVRVLAFLLEQRLAGKTLASCYLASDDDPASLWDVMNWLAKQLHLPTPISKLAATSTSQNKRCANQRLKALGFEFQYPSYQAGYGELLRAQLV